MMKKRPESKEWIEFEHSQQSRLFLSYDGRDDKILMQ